MCSLWNFIYEYKQIISWFIISKITAEFFYCLFQKQELYSHLDIAELLTMCQVIFIFEMILFWKLLVEMNTQLLSVVSSTVIDH